MDRSGLRFFPAWDVREAWVPWVGWAFAALLFWLVANGFWQMGRRAWRSGPPPADAPPAWKVAVSLCVVFLLGSWVTACSTGIYASRGPLARGTAAYSVGTVSDVRFEGEGRNAWQLFDVAGQAYRMPFVNPRICVPKDGEWVRLWSSPRTMRAPYGTATRQVLRIEMTRRCYIRPWG